MNRAQIAMMDFKLNNAFTAVITFNLDDVRLIIKQQQ